MITDYRRPGLATSFKLSTPYWLIIWSGGEVKFTLLIAILNDAACAQLRKAGSDDLSDWTDNTHEDTPIAVVFAPLRNMGKTSVKMVATCHN